MQQNYSNTTYSVKTGFYYTYTAFPIAIGIGSITEITDNTGTLLQRMQYDAWGKRSFITNNIGINNFLFDRGYTGHEHLDQFALINMNGRLYDPVLGRMLSPDNYVQNATGTQGFNRYSYALNNPLVYTDPDGEFIWMLPVVATAAFFGAYTGYRIAGAKGYGTEDEQTYEYMLGGAIIGGASGYLGATIAASGGLMANTFATVISSYTYSTSMSALSSGMMQPSINFGAASYNLGNNDWDYLGEKGNKWYADLGYGLGAFSNLTDIWAGIKGAYSSNSSLELQTDWHSQIYDPETNSTFSWGANKPGTNEPFFAPGTSIWEKLPYAPKRLAPTTNYTNTKDFFFRTVDINRVNTGLYRDYISQLPKPGQYYRYASLFSIKSMHCTIAASRSLLAGGVFNLPILRMPWLLDLQMRIRNYTYLSPYLNFQY